MNEVDPIDNGTMMNRGNLSNFQEPHEIPTLSHLLSHPRPIIFAHHPHPSPVPLF
jgi:hypothetical protein